MILNYPIALILFSSFGASIPHVKKSILPSSNSSDLGIQSLFNLFFFLNGLQLAFKALPFRWRDAANLSSVDIKGQFMLFFLMPFSILVAFMMLFYVDKR